MRPSSLVTALGFSEMRFSRMIGMFFSSSHASMARSALDELNLYFGVVASGS